MALRTVLCVVGAAEASRAATATAFSLAKTHGARITGLHVRLDPQDAVPIVAADSMTASVGESSLETARSEADERERRATAIFREEAERAGVPVIDEADAPAGGAAASLVVEQGHEHDFVAERGMLADLIVVASRGVTEQNPATATLETAVMESGRPVLVVNETPPPTLGRQTVIAWRSSVSGARALWGALPLIQQASVLTVDDGESRPPPEAVATYLAAHDIPATARTLDPAWREHGQTVLAAAGEMNADLLVMGGWVRSRLRKLVLGQMTSTVLRQARMPVLLAH